GPAQLVMGALDQLDAPGQVAVAHRRRLARLEELLAGVLADRLEQAVALVTTAGLGDDQRLVDQSRQQVEHLGRVESSVSERTFRVRPLAPWERDMVRASQMGGGTGADRLGSLERPAAREDGQTAQQRALGPR